MFTAQFFLYVEHGLGSNASNSVVGTGTKRVIFLPKVWMFKTYRVEVNISIEVLVFCNSG